MNKIVFYLWYPFLWLFSWTPFIILYFFSDIIYILVSVVGYRRKVILGNLQKAFPDQTREWRKKILHKFYHHFCDLFVETIKLQHMSEKTIKKRITFSNMDPFEEAYKNGQDLIAIMAHYGNWEYMPSINLHFKAEGFSVYRPLKSQGFDRYMLELRSQFGTKNVTMKNTLRKVIELRKSKTNFVLGLISDQSPARHEIQYWTNFLTQTTPVLMGPEKLAKLTNGKVVFLKLSKPKRGHYHVDIIEYPHNIAEAQEHEITEWHVRHLEQCIYERPELWLWSHKRWKYQNMYEGGKS
jgi:KDO2-lipid IV(A) lauroyltransferase